MQEPISENKNRCWKGYKPAKGKKPFEKGSCVKESFAEFVARKDEAREWTRKEGKNKDGGLNQKGVDSYRKENPGSKLQTAVTKKPSEIKKGSKDESRRKSFCARMTGMRRKNTGSEAAKDPDSRINKSLRKWNC